MTRHAGHALRLLLDSFFELYYFLQVDQFRLAIFSDLQISSEPCRLVATDDTLQNKNDHKSQTENLRRVEFFINVSSADESKFIFLVTQLGVCPLFCPQAMLAATMAGILGGKSMAGSLFLTESQGNSRHITA